MPAVGAFQNNFFSTIDLNELIWNFAPGASFNPSLTLLPERVRDVLNIPGAAYVAGMRHKDGQCENLGVGETRNRTMPQNVGTSSLYILDKLFRPLKSVRIDFLIGEDARLLSHNHRLIINYMTHKAVTKKHHTTWKQTWHMHGLALGIDKGSGEVFARKNSLRDALPHSKQNEYKTDRGRNFGLLHHGERTYLLSWASPDNVDAKGLLLGAAQSMYHLSANPVHIEEQGVYIATVHRHGAYKKHGALYGSEYEHNFLILEDKPPFTPKGLSKPFCVPSSAQGHINQCETIQFLASVIRDPDDPNTLIISYGVNDCGAAVTRLPLDALLRSIEFIDKDAELRKSRLFGVMEHMEV